MSKTMEFYEDLHEGCNGPCCEQQPEETKKEVAA